MTVPALDTSTASFVGAWNATEHGVSDIDPNEVVSASGVSSSTLHDNGVSGTIDPNANNANRDMTFRVKEDGWFTVHIDRRDNFARNQGSNPEGQYDVVHNWGSAVNNLDPADPVNQNSCAQAINSLQNELSNSGSITFQFSDVALYNYDYPTATAFDIISGIVQGGQTMEFSYTSGTERLYEVVLGSGRQDSFSYELDFPDGNTLASQFSLGAADNISEGNTPDAGTVYQFTSPNLNSMTGVATVFAISR